MHGPRLTLLAPLTLALACADPGPGAASDSSSEPATSEPATSAPDPTDASSTTGPDPTTTTTTTTDPGSTSLPPASDCADLPLCDDFEGLAPGAPPDPARWTISSPNCSGAGTLAIDTAVAHSGAASVRVDGGGGYCDHVFIAHSAALAGLGPRVYGRVFVRLEAALGQGHVTFMTLKDSADGDKDLRMGGQSEIFMWNRESDDATLPALSPAGIAQSTAPTPGAWTCVEFAIDGSLGELTTWVDGLEIAGLRVDAEPTPDIDQPWHGKPGWKPALTDFKLGWESYAGQTMTLYFDDVALAADRIGCDL